MKVLVASLVAGLAFAGGEKLATKYSSDRDLKYEITSSMTMEMTSMERDGEPQDLSGHSMKSETESTEVHVDHVVEVADGKPTKVRRSFEKAAGTISTMMGEESHDIDIESPFNGITLEITQGKDGVEVDVFDGKQPEGDDALKGHHLESFLDGLLPKDSVEVDASWDLEKEAVSRALRLDIRKVLFPRPDRGGGPGGEGGGGNRRGAGARGGNTGLLDDAEWKGTAKLISADKEVDGVACSVVQLKLEASGEREMPAMRPRGGMFEYEPAFENKTTYEVRLEGTFAFSNKEHRPVKLDLEGSVHSERHMEMTREEVTMKIVSKTDGKLEIAVEVSEEKPKADKAAKSDK